MQRGARMPRSRQKPELRRPVLLDTLVSALTVGVDVARLAAAGAMSAAARLSRAASDLVDPKLVAEIPRPAGSSKLPEKALASIGRRKPPAKAAARTARPTAPQKSASSKPAAKPSPRRPRRSGRRAG